MMNSLSSIIKNLKEDKNFLSCVTRWEHIPPREGKYAQLPDDLNGIIKKSLSNKGIEKLYTHQRICYETAREKKDLVVVTPTASGKTLCYNLPVLQTLMENEEARALYLFPTKALSQDQQASLNEIVLDGDLPVKICTYDGDTPGSLRISARKSGRIIITNPDMLHSGILPNHPKWIEFFKSLQYIVLDEVHTYRGVFGSHMTNLIRRIKRIAEFYGSDPVFICCSATIGNPKELTERILERETVLVDDNGSPSGEKHIILYNPPLVDPVQGIRRGIVLEAQRMALKLLKGGVKTIVFARSRVKTELISSYLNKSLSNHYNENFRIKVEPYRGGYLPGERRMIEKGLRDGTISGVVSTNALELGIDIGGLDASILAGYPGSIASAWQQAGRAGRSSQLSLSMIIASSSPVDQYLTQNPEYFFGASPESGFVDPDNLFILIDHLKCAAFEIPFKKGELFGSEVEELLDYLEENGVLRHTGDTWHWADRSYPSERISLRSGAEENVVIIDTTRGRHEVIGEMDAHSARELLFEEAVYIHKGDQYKVLKLDLENHLCHVEESTVNYYTDSILKTDIKVLGVDDEESVMGLNLVSSDILVRSEVSKYKKIKFQTHENIGYGDIFLPEYEMHTRSAVLLFSEDSPAREAFEEIPGELQAPVMSRFATVVRNTAPLFLLCGRGDIGVAGRVRDPHFEQPGLYFFDNYPGGIGLADGFHLQMRNILEASLSLIEGCQCREGCPSCVGPCDDRDDFSGNPKDATKRFLKAWLSGFSR
ncbi:DEAD/DEAH box helicase [Spirochaeta isovalerica]|uniref:DEAD/DEAH box helicase domain-containing protein n=1 Tax=Spirochaeta isovalerica TaxID=150 RepID=A0A841R7G0_9SPIO|nr:DEAD/DEAH box helicase [Spirochaeta isovalerica]MBB6478678.1 DEAD/DEAH box helicase domain-containing protein [Spirochaeta isovalerica]